MTRAKVRKISLDEMARKYKQSAVEEAGRLAEENNAHDTLAYMTKTLENGEPGNLKASDELARGRNGARKKSQVLCDGCTWPHWVDEMKVIGGRAYAKDCVPSSVSPLGAEVEERRVSQEELWRIPTDEIAYARPESTEAQRAWRDRRNEIERQRMVELEAEWPDMLDLLREHGAFKAWKILQKRPPTKAGERWLKRIREHGDMPLTHPEDSRYTVGIYGPSRETTASAKVVLAWWKEA